MKRWLISWLVVSCFLVTGCGCLLDWLGCVECESFSFEADVQDWQADGTDLGDPPIEWSVERSQELASDGTSSVKLWLNNLNDAGKIWIERAFAVEPDRRYRVRVEYAFASAAFGSVNLWRIIAGVAATSPETADDLTFQGDAGNGADSDVGYRWLQKRYTFDVESGPDGLLHVFIGVWGTWENARTHYVDDVRVCITPR